MDAPETRTSTGIAKTFGGIGLRRRSELAIDVLDMHGHLHLRRIEDGRDRLTDRLTDDEAEHLGAILIEAARRSRAAKRGAP